jgi:hypothetical protein
MSSIAGRVTCRNVDGEQLVGVTPEQRDKLTSGGLQCPLCGQACSPTFQEVDFLRDLTVLTWNQDRWQPGFMYKVSLGRP